MSDGRMTMKPQVSEFSPFDVFVSYSTKDKAVADAVVSAHEKAGFAVLVRPMRHPAGSV